MQWLLIPAASAVVALIGALYYYRWVSRQDSGTKKMNEIASAIRVGSKAFLNREYRTLAVFVGIVAVLILTFLPSPVWSSPDPVRNLHLALAYVFGSFASGLSGLLGIMVATLANVRAANAARHGLARAFPVGFRGGAVMCLAVVGTGLLGVTILYALTQDPEVVLGFSFGASSIALFAKAGGGIYTKTADISADLVGKVELGIPDDDPRNPAVIADNVGDNVGDVAGMGADLFDSNVASLVAVLILGKSLGVIEIPLVFAGLGVIASVLGILTVRVGERGNPGDALNTGTYVTCGIFLALTLAASYYFKYDLRIWGATVVGLVAGIVIGMTSDYYTSGDRDPVKKVAEASESGPALNIITGFSYGLHSVLPPLIGIGVASLIAYKLTEPIGQDYAIFGVGMAALGMLSIVGMIVSNDAYGPIVDNSRGIAEQAGLGDEVLRIADELDAAGNTAKAITKGFAIGAAGLTVIALLAAFKEIVRNLTGSEVVFDLMNPLTLLGALVGIAVPAIFSAMLMLGVGRNAKRMIAEIRRQFRDIPGLKEGKPGVKPDYARCIDIATIGALQELLPASVMAIILTLVIGFVGGIQALGGYLAGNILSGLLIALLMANAGGCWDNTKKLIETGVHGGKGSEAHKAAVVGDTVGDPFKDTAGPSINTLITVTSLVSSLAATIIVRFALIK